MCLICGSTRGHKSGCPEEDITPEVIGECEICGSQIDTDDEYFEFEGNKYCYDCFTDEYLHKP